MGSQATKPAAQPAAHLRSELAGGTRPGILKKGALGALPLRLELLVLGHPCGGAAIVLEARRGLQRVFGGVERQICLAILGGVLDRIKCHGDVLLAHGKKTSHSDDKCTDLPVWCE